MDFVIEKLDSIHICGIPIELTKSHKENYFIITDHWKKFNRKLWELDNKNSTDNWVKYAVTYKNKNKYYYMPAIPLTTPCSFQAMEIHGGSYSKFEHLGDMALLWKTINKIYKNTIPNNSLAINPERNIIHFERYDHRFKWNYHSSIIDIFVPLYKDS